jgi:hypothetical protein
MEDPKSRMVEGKLLGCLTDASDPLGLVSRQGGAGRRVFERKMLRVYLGSGGADVDGMYVADS